MRPEALGARSGPGSAPRRSLAKSACGDGCARIAGSRAGERARACAPQRRVAIAAARRRQRNVAAQHAMSQN